MSDFVTRRFRAQLTVAMDAILRKTVMDIVVIFEGSVRDYRKELSLKDEKLVKLMRQLETTECPQKEGERQKPQNEQSVNSRAEATTNAACEPPSDIAVQTSTHELVELRETPLVSLVSVESQTSMSPQGQLPRCVTDQEMPVLQNSISKIKPEIIEMDLESNQPPKVVENELDSPQTSKARKKRKGSSRQKGAPRKKKLVKPTPQVKDNPIIYLRDIKDDYNHLHRPKRKPEDKPLARRRNSPKVKARTTFVLKKRVAAREEPGGRRSHKRVCGGCLKPFLSPAVYQDHLKSCSKLKHRNDSRRPGKPGSADGGVRFSHRLSPHKRPRVTQEKLSSVTKLSSVMDDHFCCHVCQKRLSSKRSLKRHVNTIHMRDNMDHSWTKPLEMEDELL